MHLQGLWKLLWRGDSPFVEKFYAARKFTEINIGQWAVVSGKRQRQVSYIVSCCTGCAVRAPPAECGSHWEGATCLTLSHLVPPQLFVCLSCGASANWLECISDPAGVHQPCTLMCGFCSVHGYVAVRCVARL